MVSLLATCAGGVFCFRQPACADTVGQVGCLAGLVGIGYCGGIRRLARLGGLVWYPFTVVTLGMPGATKLYLFGISISTSSSTPIPRGYRHRRPATYDLHRFATVLPTGLVLDRRGGADRDAPAQEMFKPW